MCFRLGCNVPDDNMEVGGYTYKEGWDIMDPFKISRTRIRKDFNHTFFDQIWDFGFSHPNRRGNQFLRKYYYTKEDSNGSCLSHLFKYKTQCTTEFWNKSGNMWDYTPHPPKLIYGIPLAECRFWNLATRSKATPREGNYDNSKRAIPSVYPKEIADTHALFYGGLPKFRPFNAWFYKQAIASQKRVDKIKEMIECDRQIIFEISDGCCTEPDHLFNIFECHYLEITDALIFETKFLRFLRSNIGRWTQDEPELRAGKMAGEKDYYPLNEFWEVDPKKGIYRTNESFFNLWESMLAGADKYNPEAIDYVFGLLSD